MSPQAYEQWCRSLLGREWEIYWEQEANAVAADADTADVTDSTGKEEGVDSNNNNDLDDDEDEDEAYDAD
eukprot:scaffold418600_cov24-Attheya_sp.AAC.1